MALLTVIRLLPGYRPQVSLHATYVSGTVGLPTGRKMAPPGDNAKARGHLVQIAQSLGRFQVAKVAT